MEVITMETGVLVLSALLTSILSGVMGMGGGVLLLTIMMQFFPPAILIPIHGAIQWSSNVSRAFFNREAIIWRMTIPFIVGAAVGAVAGSGFVISLDEATLKLVLGIFILILTWMPKADFLLKVKNKYFFLGGIVSFLSLFVGATGPLIAPFFLREKLSNREVVATKASFQIFIHSFKVITFFALGFSFKNHWQIMSLMIGAVILGSYIGRQFIGRLKPKNFKWIFKLIITVLAGKMLISTLLKIYS